MKRLFLMAAFSIALLTLLAACGGGSSEDQPSSQETSSSTGIVEPTSQETSSTGASPTVASVVDPEGRVQTYLALMDQLATALRSMDTTDLSADALDPITEITDDLEDYSEFEPCLVGPGGELEVGCGCADLDGDNDADLADLAGFQAAFGG